MASRVNVKFVVILALVLVAAAAGTSVLAWKVVFKTPEELARRGDVKLAEGEIRAAELLYSKAVNKDPYNSVYLLKWREALEQWVPETDRELQTEFSTTYRQLHNQLARSDGMSHIEYQLEYLQLMSDWIRDQRFSRSSQELIANEATSFIDVQETANPDDPRLAELKRIRAMAMARIALEDLALTPEQMRQTQEDFEAALAHDPTDYEAMFMLVGMQQSALDKAESAGRITEAGRLREQSEETLNGFIRANGEDSVPGAMGQMMRLQTDLREQVREILAQGGEDAIPQIQALRDQYQAFTEEVADRLESAESSEISDDMVRRVFALETQTNSANDFSATLPLLESLREREPEDLSMAVLHSEVLASRGDFMDAVTILQSILAKPRLPLSLEAVRRLNARALAAANIANYSLRAIARAGEGEDTDGWLDRAQTAREELGKLIPEQAPAITLLDAKLALAREDLARAQTLLDEHNTKTEGGTLESLWLSSQVAQRLNQPGKAESALERILLENPGDPAAHVALANIQLELNRPESALGHLQQAQRARPDDERLADRIRALREVIDPSTVTDPIRRALFEAQRVANGGETQIADPARGIQMLDEAIAEHGNDAELLYLKTVLQLRIQNVEGAAETLRLARSTYPDNEQFIELEPYIRAGQASTDELVQIVREGEQSEILKLLSIHQIYTEAGRTDDARATLLEAERVDPNNRMLIEQLFIDAYSRRDMARVQEIASRAQASDSDGMGGLTYRARIMILEGKNDEALAALVQATQRQPNNASVWRMLGDHQVRMDRLTDAIASYQQALNLKPGDVETILDYGSALANLGRMPEALELARRSESTARNSRRFMEMLLTLEAQVGDKASARSRREKLLAAQPDNMPNRHALIGLYISLGERDQAMGLLNQTRQEFGQSDELVDLEARWYAEANLLDDARAVHAKHIADTPPDERVSKYLSLARFMLSNGRSRNGIIALKQAADAEEPGVYEMDRVLAATLMQFGRNSEAYEILEELIELDLPDPEHRLKLQAAEALLGVDRLTDAEAMLGRVPNADTNQTAVLLRSRLQLKRGDDRGARATLDDAVSRWPEDYRVWILRAEANAQVPELVEDALADLEQAISIAPAVAEAHKRKAELLARLDRIDEAIAAWREAVRLLPQDEDLRGALLATLVQLGKEGEALQLAAEWFERRPRDVGLRARVADLFLLGGMREAAIQTYQDAVQIDKQPQLLLRLVDLLLGSQPQRAIDAERVLADARTVVATDPALLLGRARVFVLTNRAEAARNDALTSFRLAPKNSDSMTFWFTTIRSVFDNQQDLLAFFRLLAQQQGAAEWASLFTGRALLADQSTASTGMQELEGVISRTRDPAVRYSGLRIIAGHHYNAGRFEQAIAAWKQALALKANDWQVGNNIAYALATDLGRPEEALPYAEEAALQASENPEVLDTLGTTYIALGRAAEAIPPLEAAVQATRGTPRDAQYMVRLAQARLAAGERQGASDLVAQIQPLLDRGRKLDDQYQAILAEVREGLGGE